jgi:hypothetical protein
MTVFAKAPKPERARFGYRFPGLRFRRVWRRPRAGWFGRFEYPGRSVPYGRERGLHLYVPGYNDGLKIDPTTRRLWALQNEDANPNLVIINPENHQQRLYTFGRIFLP